MSDSEELTSTASDMTDRVPDCWDPGDTDQEEVRELEPEQKSFLSRLVEMSEAPSAVDITPLAPARLNFGMQETKAQSKPSFETPARHVLKQQSNDKGYFGVLRSSGRKDKKGKQKKGRSDGDRTQSVPISKIHSETSEVSTNSSLVEGESMKTNQKILPVENSKSMCGKVGENPTVIQSRDEPVNLTSVPSSAIEQQKSSFIIPDLTSLLPPGFNNEDKNPSKFSLPDLGTSQSSSQLTLPSSLNQKSDQALVTSSPGNALNALVDLHLSSTEGSSMSVPSLSAGLAKFPTALGTSPAAGGSLASLGKAHLSSVGATPFSVPSLIGGSSSSPGTSLTSLASQHLSSSPSFSSVKDISSNASQQSPASSLSSLASFHLTSNTTPSSQLTLPDLNLTNPSASLSKLSLTDGKGPDSENAVKRDREPTPEPDIDLTAALRLHSEAESPDKDIAEPEPVYPETKVYLADLTNLKTSLLLGFPSAFGKVVTKRWRRRCVRTPLNLSALPVWENRFRFLEPSPDDVVKKAQLQSKSFLNRASQSPART